jgi:excisionase family DNA binding protein
MKKADAAKFLEISEKTLERLVKNGEISSKLEKGKTRDVVVFDDEELKVFKEKRESSKHRPAFSTDDLPAQNSLLLIPTKTDNIDRQNQTFEFLEVLTNALTSQKSVVPIADKVLLTVKECRALTGLSEQTIRDAIRDERLKSRVIGLGFKVKRSDLNEFINTL